ncbi:Sulfite reductase [NADPH] flavoprotein alpha-component [Nymphon striatum]|nr:Sulfite reductase [NADPH] flavoprotein alpha-component [Nymphon striatum]
MEILSQQQIQRVSSAVEGLNPSQLAWVTGYLTGLSINVGSERNTQKIHSLTQASTFEQKASSKTTILYGSQTGNSKRIAEELNNALLADGIHSSFKNLLDYRPAQLKKEEKVVFVISTQGNGEPPDEALSFFKFIESDRAPKLDHIEYAVLGLGDSSYDEFCETGVTLDKRLADLGAKRFLDRVDADIDFEEDAAVWQKDVINYLEADVNNDSSQSSLLSEQESINNVLNLQPKWSETNPYQAEILGIVNLTAEGSEQEVSAVLVEAKLDGSANVTIKGQSFSLKDALLSKLEISKITSKVVKNYAESTASQELHKVVNDKNILKEFTKGKDLLDLLEAYPEEIDAQQLVDTLRPLISRQYSIASSAQVHTDEVHILIKPVSYEYQGREHLGVASNWLKHQQVGDTIPLYIKSNPGFKLPENPEDKIIMIGAGTGVAPYRSFLFERESLIAEGKSSQGNSWLFFGEQRFQTFSRDQKEKIYVQHKLLEEAETLYQWLQEGATLYVCGDIDRMAADVHQALIQIVSEQSDKSHEEAENWLDELKASKRTRVMTISKETLAHLNDAYSKLELVEGLKILTKTFNGKLSLSSSLGPEDQVITDAIFRNDIDIDVFSLDTGRLFAESYKVLDDTIRKYNKEIQVYYPKHDEVQQYVSTQGINALYDSVEQRKECCYIRKIEPLNRALEGVEVWVTGLRGSQSDYRSNMNYFEWDEERNLIKFNPLLAWSTEEIWHYINAFEVPYNELHQKGFPSIGCQPCTRAIGLHEHERAGRWWWEDIDKKECGLHASDKKETA